VTRKSIFFLFLIVASLYAEENRTLSVCVLNDAAKVTARHDKIAHVAKREIEQIVRNASREYESNVGIILKIVEYHDTLIPMAPAGAYAERFRAACHQGEIVAVFTNQEGIQENPLVGFIHLAGYHELRNGVVWNYEVASEENTPASRMRSAAISLFNYHRFGLGESGDNPTTTFKHEVAHLFGVKHSMENVDFMYWGVGSDAWSDRIRETIRKNRDRKWGH
jgi:hypothetical protein